MWKNVICKFNIIVSRLTNNSGRFAAFVEHYNFGCHGNWMENFMKSSDFVPHLNIKAWNLILCFHLAVMIVFLHSVWRNLCIFIVHIFLNFHSHCLHVGKLVVFEISENINNEDSLYIWDIPQKCCNILCIVSKSNQKVKKCWKQRLLIRNSRVPLD